MQITNYNGGTSNRVRLRRVDEDGLQQVETLKDFDKQSGTMSSTGGGTNGVNFKTSNVTL